MGNAQNLQCVNAEASGTLATKQYCFMHKATDGQVEMATATTTISGILQEKPTAEGQGCLLAIGGYSKLVVDGSAGGGIAVGSKLASDAAGKGVVTSANLDDYGAIAQEASTADGDIITVLVVPGREISSA